MVVSVVLTGADLAMRVKGKPGAEAVLGLLSITFADAAKKYFDLHSAKWSNAKHRQTFLNTLKQYADPVIGTTPVAEVPK